LDPSLEANKLFVGGLLKNTSEEEIRGYFSQFGAVFEVLLKRDTLTGASRGFGFVTFQDPEGLHKALANYNNNAIGGKWVDVRKAMPQQIQEAMPQQQIDADSLAISSWTPIHQEPQPGAPLVQAIPPGSALPDEADGRKLFLGGLPYAVSENDILQLFSQWGAVEDAVVKRDHGGHSRGFGFVTFVDPASLQKAMEERDKIVLAGKWVESRPAGGYKGHVKGSGWRVAPY